MDGDAAAQLQFSADQVSLRLEERLRTHEMILRGGAGLFTASDRVDRERWRRFVQALKADELVPGVQGIGYAVWIAPGTLAAHEAGVRAEGFPDYRVKPEGDRRAHTAITFIEPFEGRNLRAFGFDMYSEPVRREAMGRARDTGEAALSGKVVLVQEAETDIQAGTLMYVPVYRPDLPTATLAQRREALLGWAYSPYRMNNLMAGLLKGWQSEEGRYLHLRIYDGTLPAPEHLLFDSAGPDGGAAPAPGRRPALRRTLEFHGRPWLLEFERSRAAPGISYLPVWLMAGSGLTMSALLFGLLMSLASTRERGLRLAHTLTEAIRQREHQLEESEFRWRFALEGSGDGLWDWNVAEDTVWHSNRYLEMLGTDPGRPGKGVAGWSDRIHPDDRDRTLAALQACLRGETPAYSCEHRLRRDDGRYLWVLDRGVVVERGEAGEVRRMIGTQADITRSKELEASLRRSQSELEEAQRIARFASWTLDKASGQVTWTPQLFRMLGLPVSADGSAPPFETHRDFFTPEGYGRLVQSLDRLLAEGESYELELEMVRADGSRGWMQARGEPVRAADGTIIGVHGVAADITERMQAQQRIEQLNRLFAALSECNWAIVHCASESELLERVCDVLVRHGGIDTAWISLVEPATGNMRPGYARGKGADAVGQLPASADPGEPSGKGPIGTAVRELRPVWIEDLQANASTRDWQALAARFGWQCAACLPLMRQRSVFAVLTLFSTRSGWAEADTRQLVEQIGSNVNFALDKLGIETDAKAFRKQQMDAQERFRMLVDSSRVGAFIIQEGVIRYANPRAGEILGLPGPDRLVGLRLADIAEPAHRGLIGQALADLTQGRAKVINTTISAARPDGSRIDIGVNATLASEGDHAPVLGLIEDASTDSPPAKAP